MSFENKKPRAFAAYNRNKDILKKSSSGGLFFALASSIINDYKGVVYGCVIINGDVFHTKADNINDLLPMLGSKYVRSDLKNTFFECKNDLISGKYVLYSGTPCQLNSLNFYLNRNNVNKDKFIGLDIVCHGTPMKKWWKKYLELNFKDVTNLDVCFRYKKYGWNDFYFKINNYESLPLEDPFFKAFLANKILNESCYNCTSKGENRSSDITLGDFWGIEKIYGKAFNNDGVSLVIIRSNIDFIFTLINKQCILKEVPYLESFYFFNQNYYKSEQVPNDGVFNEKHLMIKKNKKFSSNEKKSKANHINLIKYIIKKHDVYMPTIYINKKKNTKNNKIGIITDVSYDNYGNRLQNYALIIYLKKHGKKTQNIIFESNHFALIHYIYYFIKRRKNTTIIKKPDSVYKTSIKYEGSSFIFSKIKKKQKKLCRYETIVVGSDQIWNYGYHLINNDLEYSLGNFGIINPPYNLVSYAASICQNKIEYDEEFLFKNSLNNFSHISVRENQSKELLSSIGFNSIKVIDPTFLLIDCEWEYAIAKYAKQPLPKKKYQLNYIFDGNCGIVYDKECEEIVDYLVPDKYNQFDFINYIKNSLLVVTNSFHALVFCIIFRKRVYLIRRDIQGMESRIDELLQLCGIEKNIDGIYDFSFLNWNLIDELKEISIKYIEKAIL